MAARYKSVETKYLEERDAALRALRQLDRRTFMKVLAATAGAVATWNAGPAFGPHWYPLALVVTALPCVWAGGLLHERWLRANP